MQELRENVSNLVDPHRLSKDFIQETNCRCGNKDRRKDDV